MPAQTLQGKAVYYVEFDTAPPLKTCLKDGDGNPINLVGCDVNISIAWSFPRGSYYTSPRDYIVPFDPVDIIDPTQLDEDLVGWVSWTPGTEVGVDALSPPGEFLYQFQITYQDDTVQTIPANTYLPLIIKTRVGGRPVNQP